MHWRERSTPRRVNIPKGYYALGRDRLPGELTSPRVLCSGERSTPRRINIPHGCYALGRDRLPGELASPGVVCSGERSTPRRVGIPRGQYAPGRDRLPPELKSPRGQYEQYRNEADKKQKIFSNIQAYGLLQYCRIYILYIFVYRLKLCNTSSMDIGETFWTFSILRWRKSSILRLEQGRSQVS